MKKKYKALMLDLDGTTFPNKKDGVPSNRVQQAIQKATKKIAVGIATSRPLEIALPLIKKLPVNAPCIVSSGALIIDPQTNQTLFEQPMLLHDVSYIGNYIKKHRHKMLFADHTGTILPYETLPTKVFDLLIIHLTPKQAEIVITDLSHLPTIALNKIVSWTSGEIEICITHVAATKQHGIFKVAELLHIQTQEIIGVGDGPNDFPLLMACGLKIAMGNAVPALKEIADYIAPSVEDDGVAHLIEKFIITESD
jgi:HAD superfamily hydrolase (TIGR01484 family)